MKDTKPESQSLRILKTGSTPTVTGKSTLGYSIGCNDKGEIHFRVDTNSGGGYFKPEAVSWPGIQKVLVLETYPHITSFAFRSLFTGKSSNSPGFLLAVLVAEGLLQPKGGNERYYIATDPAKFLAEMKALMEANPDSDAATPAAAIKKGRKS